MNTFIERILGRAKSLPEAWCHVDALTEPGPDASPSAHHHWHCLKVLRAIAGAAAARGPAGQPRRVRDLVGAAHQRYVAFADVERHAAAASRSGPIGPAHNAVLLLAAHVGVPGLGQSSYGASETWQPADVPPESTLLTMAAACINEHGSHWSILDPLGKQPRSTSRNGRQDVITALIERGATSEDKAVPRDTILKHDLKRAGKDAPAELVEPLVALGLVGHKHERPPLIWLQYRPFGYDDC